jgi:hypothetical protein
MIFLCESIRKLNVLVRFVRNWYGAYNLLHLHCIVRFTCSVLVYSYIFFLYEILSRCQFFEHSVFEPLKCQTWRSSWAFLSYLGILSYSGVSAWSIILSCLSFWGVGALRYVRAFRDVVGGLSCSVVSCCSIILILYAWTSCHCSGVVTLTRMRLSAPHYL